MEPRASEPIQVTLNATAAHLLARLAAELGTEDVSGLVVRALGLLEMAQRARLRGEKLVFRSHSGHESEVAF
ncbi:MAG: hypothetical protein HY698_00895 [Deltaproteobacteria bacterium]|nr:hypothetical protein [Deltaproteobacteria bacterium]